MVVLIEHRVIRTNRIWLESEIASVTNIRLNQIQVTDIAEPRGHAAANFSAGVKTRSNTAHVTFCRLRNVSVVFVVVYTKYMLFCFVLLSHHLSARDR